MYKIFLNMHIFNWQAIRDLTKLSGRFEQESNQTFTIKNVSI